MYNINAVINEWSKRQICFLGFIHSHINGCLHLSDEDKCFIHAQLNGFSHLPFMWFPIIDPLSKEMVVYKCEKRMNEIIYEKYIKKKDGSFNLLCKE